MTNIKNTIFLLTLAVFGLISCKQNQTTEIRDDFKKHYNKFQVEGSFVLYDQQNDKYIFYNKDQYIQMYSPASTFKICNTLIGLETEVIKDENFVIPWDSVTRQNSVWNKDHDLKTAFKNSNVWYYQELARRVNGKRMKFWLDKVNYGNADTSGGIDKFWLSGGLRVSPEQQIDFLKRLHDNQLPFSPRALDIVKNIMIVKDTMDYIIRAKTGWADEEKRMVGWYVGYIEQADNTYYFANCIQTNNFDHPDFAKARIEITFTILNELNLIKK
jgi:beta-lactamase class D